MKIYTQLIVVFLLSILYGNQISAQQLDFELRYNDATSMYEVYATPDSTNSLYFVGGGSQLSLVLPQDLDDVPLQINTVAGGLWTDNSRIFKPESDHIHDFHGIASNGAIVNFVEGEALLLFTFELPGGVCRSDIRLFENSIDPGSSATGMAGGDFKNFFANVFYPFENNWKKNDNDINASCAYAPMVASQLLTIEQGESETICMPIVDLNLADSFQGQLCNKIPANGNGMTQLSVSGNELCLTYTPNANFIGTEEVCIEVCDQTGLCNTAMVSVVVVPEVVYSTIAAYGENCQNVIDWTIYNPSEFTHYELQRKEEGQDFELLGQFESSNQSANQLLNFIDEGTTKGDYYYRLKLVSTDGGEKYSEEVFVKSDCVIDDELIINYATISAYDENCQNVVDLTIYRPSDFTHYELQRSDDGQHFEMLDQFASNNQSSNQGFHFIDEDVKGNHYYRLKLVFADGREEYSEEVFVKSDCKIDGDLIIYPNPVSHSNPILNVKFFAETQNMNFIISDVQGRTLRRINLGVELGLNILRLDVSDLATGNYFILIEGKNEIAKSFSKLDERF